MVRKAAEKAPKNLKCVVEEFGMEVDDSVDMLCEIMKHLDARSLASAACVNRRWRETASDEKLWEGICTNNWSSITTSCKSTTQFRSVVHALGGFRRLYVLCLRQLRLKTPTQSSEITKEWSKNEIHLSLSLLSIDCYERLGRGSCSPSTLNFLLMPSTQCAKEASFERRSLLHALLGITQRKHSACIA